MCRGSGWSARDRGGERQRHRTTGPVTGGLSAKLFSLVLPAYNEAPRIAASLERCVAYLAAQRAAEIIVADDGSTDGTTALVREIALRHAGGPVPIRHLVLPHRGKGAAVRSGVEAAQGDPIAYLDADLAIPPEILEPFSAAIAAGADVVAASRYVPGSTVSRPLRRRLVGGTYRACVSVLVPTGVADTQCGGKAYRAATARRLFALQRLDGFAFDTEVLFIARRSGYRVVEVPFALVQDRNTSIDLRSQVPRMLADLARIRLSELRGSYGRRASDTK